jgi:hypothetical protein
VSIRLTKEWQDVDAEEENFAKALPDSTSEKEIIAFLASLPRLDYEKPRKQQAELLGCRTSILDKLVETARPKTNEGLSQGGSVNFPEIGALALTRGWCRNIGRNFAGLFLLR